MRNKIISVMVVLLGLAAFDGRAFAAWTTPRTWVAEELVTATMMNTHIRDNENALRDYILGAQDLGADWQISGSTARQLRFQSSAVAHGMTSIVPTDIFGQIFENSAGVGGLRMRGLSEAGADIAVYLVAMTGSAAPTTGALVFDSYKKSGTSVAALASSEPILDARNGGTTAFRIYGDGGAYFTAGLNVGFVAVPSDDEMAVGDANFRMAFNSGTPALYFNSNAYITWDRSATLNITLPSYGISVNNTSGLVSLTNAAGTGGMILQTAEVTAPAAPSANFGKIYLDDNGAGKTRLMVIFSSGAAQQIAIQP